MRLAVLSRTLPVLLLICPVVLAQETSSQKKALIDDLLLITDVTKNAEAIRSSISAQIEKDIATLLNGIILQDKKLVESERQALLLSASKNARQSRERFEQVFAERVNYSQLVRDVSYEVYDKHFSIEELRDLITFYRTPTGAKTIKILPELFAESMAKTSERLLPKIEPLINEIVAEETKRIEEMMPKRTPAKKQRRQRRAP